LTILNQNEIQLDMAVDNETKFNMSIEKGPLNPKFKFINLNFVDKLLDLYYNNILVFKEIRIHRKLNLKFEDLLMAIIFALKTQRIYFKI